jgi:uncharacterized protein
MKVVLDVGQYISAVIHQGGYPAQLLHAWEAQKFDLLLSPSILADIHRVLHYPRIQKRHQWDTERIERFIQTLTTDTILTPAQLELGVVKDDPDDNKIIVCAVEGNADYIVSSDIHLAKLGTYQGIPIVPPRQLVAQLEL